MNSNELKTQNNFSFFKISLKFEDKIILGIGVMFFISLLIFVNFAHRVLNHLENQNKRWERPIQSTPPIQTKQTIQVPPRKTIVEEHSRGSEEAFRRLERKFKENQAKRDAAFNVMEKNFKERFKKATAAQDQWRKRHHKWFNESTARSSEEFDKKAAAYGAGLPNYADGTPKEKKNDPHK